MINNDQQLPGLSYRTAAVKRELMRLAKRKQETP